LLTDRSAQAGDFACDPVLVRKGLVERLRDLPIGPRPSYGQSGREITVAKRSNGPKDPQGPHLGSIFEGRRPRSGIAVAECA
jgi:hypothetical protein